jgi:MtrB/PioB family decaheme-associated outer membrane protein
LPAQSLHGRDHKTYANVGLTSREGKRFDFAASYSYDDRDNRTPRMLFDYPTNDVQDQPQPLVAGVSAYFRYNLPYSFTFQQAKAEVGYRLTPRTRLSATYTGDFKSRTYAEVARTQEHTFKLKALSSFSMGSAWLSYSYANRTGTNYSADTPWDLSHTAAYLGASPNNHEIEYPLLRKFELADRQRHELKGGGTLETGTALVVDVSGTYARDLYTHSLFGLRSDDDLALDTDVAYVFAKGLSASVFYSYDQITSRQRGYFLATLSLTNPAQIWGARNRDVTHTAGVHMDWDAIPQVLKLRGAYYLSDGTTHIDVNATPFTPLAASTPLPDARDITHNLSFKAEYAVRGGTTLKVGYTLERHVTHDWQYANMGFAPVAQIVGSGIIPPRYTAHVISITARHEF